MKGKANRKRMEREAEREDGKSLISHELSMSTRSGTVFASSRLAAKRKKLISGTRKFISENFEALRRGSFLKDEKLGIAVHKAATGSHEGSHNYLTLRVVSEEGEFFVKVASRHAIKNNLNGLTAADKWLKARNYTFEGMKIRAILPLQAVAHRKIAYIVTRFMKKGEVSMLSESKEFHKLKPKIGKLAKELAKIGVTDVVPENTYSHHKTNTLLLFDLNAKQAKEN